MPKINNFMHGCMRGDYIILKPKNKRDIEICQRLFNSKTEREQRRQQEIFIDVSLDIPFQKRSIKQSNLAFKLVDIIFVSMENRKPCESERLSLYYELLEVYADREPCRLRDGTKPVHLSQANTVQVANFIDNLIGYVAELTKLPLDQQTEAFEVIKEWEMWRGQQPVDFTAKMTESEWRERAKYSEASGLRTNLDLHHILTKGAHENLRNNPENWMCLTREEHQLFHDKGEKTFIQNFPHLEGRIQKAHELTTKSL